MCLENSVRIFALRKITSAGQNLVSVIGFVEPKFMRQAKLETVQINEHKNLPVSFDP